MAGTHAIEHNTGSEGRAAEVPQEPGQVLRDERKPKQRKDAAPAAGGGNDERRRSGEDEEALEEVDEKPSH